MDQLHCLIWLSNDYHWCPHPISTPNPCLVPAPGAILGVGTSKKFNDILSVANHLTCIKHKSNRPGEQRIWQILVTSLLGWCSIRSFRRLIDYWHSLIISSRTHGLELSPLKPVVEVWYIFEVWRSFYHHKLVMTSLPEGSADTMT